MPQVGVAEADQQVDHEQRQEDPLDQQEIFSLFADLFSERFALHIGKRTADPQNDGEGQSDIDACERHAVGSGHPRQPGPDEQTRHASERIAFI